VVALLGCEANCLSATTIARLKAGWSGDYTGRQRLDLSTWHYVYLWLPEGDGIHIQARLENEAQCILIISAMPV